MQMREEQLVPEKLLLDWSNGSVPAGQDTICLSAKTAHAEALLELSRHRTSIILGLDHGENIPRSLVFEKGAAAKLELVYRELLLNDLLEAKKALEELIADGQPENFQPSSNIAKFIKGVLLGVVSTLQVENLLGKFRHDFKASSRDLKWKNMDMQQLAAELNRLKGLSVHGKDAEEHARLIENAEYALDPVIAEYERLLETKKHAELAIGVLLAFDQLTPEQKLAAILDEKDPIQIVAAEQRSILTSLISSLTPVLRKCHDNADEWSEICRQEIERILQENPGIKEVEMKDLMFAIPISGPHAIALAGIGAANGLVLDGGQLMAQCQVGMTTTAIQQTETPVV